MTGALTDGLTWGGLSIGLLGALWVLARYYEWQQVFQPARRVTATPMDFGLEYEDVRFVAEDDCTLHGWWIPHPQARGTILYCHGNAGNIGDRAALVADLHRLRTHLFIFDYRGYGQSRGFPTEAGTYRDARAAFEVVRARHGDPDRPPVVVYGRSLGGAVAIQLALEKPAAGLIVEGCFTSVRDLAASRYPGLPVRRTCWFRYDAVGKVGQLKVPALFAHSRADEVVPYDLGRKLYNAAAEPKCFFELTGGHNESGWESTPGYWPGLEAFVTSVLGA